MYNSTCIMNGVYIHVQINMYHEWCIYTCTNQHVSWMVYIYMYNSTCILWMVYIYMYKSTCIMNSVYTCTTQHVSWRVNIYMYNSTCILWMVYIYMYKSTCIMNSVYTCTTQHVSWRVYIYMYNSTCIMNGAYIHVQLNMYYEWCIYACTTQHVSWMVYIYMFLNERWEGRKKEASKVKQTNKAKQHSTPKAVTFHVQLNMYHEWWIYTCTTQHVSWMVYIYMFLNERWEGRKKEASKVKQTRQSNTAHPRQSLFLEKMSCLRWDSNPRHSIL